MRRLSFALLLAVTLATCNDNPPPPSSGISMNADAWTIGPVIDGKDYSVGMPLRPTTEGSGWRFDFPKSCGKQPDCSVHYVTVGAGGLKPSQSQSISAKFTITASSNAVFNCRIIPNNPEGYSNEPAETMFVLQHKNDDWNTELYRYFSYPERTKLSPGTYTVTVPLTPDKWISMMGKPAAATMTDTLNNLANVGLVFGGCGYAGHGVQMAQGTARFALDNFTIGSK
jgi:hypothetical protein